MISKTLSRGEIICNDKVIKYIFLFYVVLLIVQDMSLQVSLGTIARSPYVFLSPLIFLFITITSNKIYFFKPTQYYLVYYLYSILITLVLILNYSGFNDFRYVYGENLYVKCIKNSMYNFIIILTLYNFYFIFRYSEVKFLEKILKVLVFLQLAIGYIQMVLPNAFDFIKTPAYNYTERISLLNTEPSYTFPQFVISLLSYGCIRYYNNKRFKIVDYLVLLLGFILLMFIQSRGGIIVMLVCIILIVLFSKQSLIRRLLLFSASIIFIIPTVWVIVNIILPQIIADLESFSSISTRSITILTALKSLVTYPFGQGYGTYLITFPSLLDKMIGSVILVSPIPLSTWELDWMLSTGRALTIKSGLLNEVLYTGWGIILFYIFFFGYAYKQLKLIRDKKTVHSLFQYIFLFIIINFLFVSSIETAYIAFLPFALIGRLSREAKYTV
jgi:hypothetical protein